MLKAMTNFQDPSAARPRVYLHVGRGRTGTASLQKFLLQNRPVLAKAGIIYPPEPAGWSPKTKEREVGNATWLAQAAKSRQHDPEAVYQALQTYLTELKTAHQPVGVILSTELLYGFSADQLTSIRLAAERAGFDTIVVCFIREQLGRLISVYSQGVKKGKIDVSLEDFLTYRLDLVDQVGSDQIDPSDYLQVLTRFSDVFGEKGVVVRAFERDHLAGGDVRVEMLSVLGLSPDGYELSDSVSNESAGAAELDLLRRLNALRDIYPVNGQKFFDIAAKSGAEQTSPISTIAPELINKVRSRYSRSNAEVAAAYFPNLNGPLFPSANKAIQPHSTLPSIDDAVLKLLLQYLSATVVSEDRRRRKAESDADPRLERKQARELEKREARLARRRARLRGEGAPARQKRARKGSPSSTEQG